MENYKKKYKDALSRARAVYSTGGCNDLRLEFIFPELTESEDEKIRKWLIRTVRLIGVDKDICADQETMDEAIAWLEKQKEQKPRLIGEDSVEKMARQMYETRQTIEEQKPAEWSKEDERVIEAACALLCEYAGYYKEKDMEAKDLQLFKVSQRLKSLRPSWTPSEEQISALEEVIEYCPEGDAYDILSELTSDLKKL